jgi:hypothetical protein
MNQPLPHPENRPRLAAKFVLTAGALTLVGALMWWVVRRSEPPGLDAARVRQRLENLARWRAENAKALTNSAEIDPSRGIWRLPLARATELALQFASDPAAGRSNLLARLEKATAKPPEKPNPYE